MIEKGQMVQLHAYPLPCALNRTSTDRHAINSGLFPGSFTGFLFAITIQLNERRGKNSTELVVAEPGKPFSRP